MLENPLSESTAFLEPLSPWKQIKPVKGIRRHSSSFETLRFGDNHVQDQDPPEPSSCSSASSTSPRSSLSSVSISYTDTNLPVSAVDIQESQKNGGTELYQERNESCSYTYSKSKHCRHSDSFSSMNSESLSLCTEGLGFESFDDVEDVLRNDILGMIDLEPHEERTTSFPGNSYRGEYMWGMRSATSIGSSDSFPPPISCIGRSGKPLVCFRSFKQNGRFVLKEIRIPTQDLLHACRENGRLKMKFVASDEDEIIEEEEEDIEGKDEDDDKIMDAESPESYKYSYLPRSIQNFSVRQTVFMSSIFSEI